MIAPSAYHRMTFQHQEKPNIIRIGTGQMVVGLLALAVAMNGAVLFVTDVLFDTGTTIVAIVCLGALYATLWFGLGLVRRLQS